MLAMIIPLAARTFGTKNGNPIYNLAIYYLQFSFGYNIESTLGRKAGRVFLFHTEITESTEIVLPSFIERLCHTEITEITEKVLPSFIERLCHTEITESTEIFYTRLLVLQK